MEQSNENTFPNTTPTLPRWTGSPLLAGTPGPWTPFPEPPPASWHTAPEPAEERTEVSAEVAPAEAAPAEAAPVDPRTKRPLVTLSPHVTYIAGVDPRTLRPLIVPPPLDITFIVGGPREESCSRRVWTKIRRNVPKSLTIGSSSSSPAPAEAAPAEAAPAEAAPKKKKARFFGDAPAEPVPVAQVPPPSDSAPVVPSALVLHRHARPVDDSYVPNVEDPVEAFQKIKEARASLIKNILGNVLVKHRELEERTAAARAADQGAVPSEATPAPAPAEEVAAPAPAAPAPLRLIAPIPIRGAAVPVPLPADDAEMMELNSMPPMSGDEGSMMPPPTAYGTGSGRCSSPSIDWNNYE